MKITIKKRAIFVLFLLLSIFLVLLRYSTFIHDVNIDFIVNNVGFIHNILLFAPIILLFSILTYSFPQKYFISWWKFARYAIPTVFVLVTLINLQLHHTPGGWMNLDHAFDRLFIVALYGLFIIGSLIQLIRGYYSEHNDISSVR